MIGTIILFVVILGLLVFVHEAGHFFIAKRSGMKVDEFGFGFPPRLFGLQKISGKWRIVWGAKQPSSTETTVYSVNWIPLGGFVKIVGENNEAQDDPKSFTNKAFFPRLLTLLGGVLMNVVLAWFLFSLGYIVGLPVAVDSIETLPKGARLVNQQVAIAEVVKDSPAAKAGLESGDVIISIDGKNIGQISEVQEYILSKKGQEIELSFQRVDAPMSAKVQPLADPPEGQGPTGVVLATIGLLKLPWYTALLEGVTTTYHNLGAIVVGLYEVFTTSVGLQSLGGPVKIAQLTGQVAHLGISYLIQFTAFLSLNLAILNILPFPALDGGRVLFLVIEKIRRKPNNQHVEQYANSIGFVLLLLLMLVITIRDVNSLGGVGRILSKLIGG